MHFKFLFLMMMCLTLQSVQQAQRKECCDTLSVVAYKAMSCCLANDYFTLAYNNACWMLRMKLKSREQMRDINRYYLGRRTVINGQEYSVWMSPLHEAIRRGHVAAVEILCDAGANKSQLIRSDINDTEKAEGRQTDFLWIEQWYSNETEAQSKRTAWLQSHYVGLSAVELARVLMNARPDPVGDDRRRRIYEMLQ